MADIWHVGYRRLKSPAFAKCAHSRDFLRSSPRIASEVNQSCWAILSHDFSKWRKASILGFGQRRKKQIWSFSGQENRVYLNTLIAWRNKLPFRKSLPNWICQVRSPLLLARYANHMQTLRTNAHACMLNYNSYFVCLHYFARSRHFFKCCSMETGNEKTRTCARDQRKKSPSVSATEIACDFC